MNLDLPWVAEHLDRSDGFPRIDWDAVGPRLMRDFAEEDLHEAFTAAARHWIAALRDTLGAPYRIDESATFLVLSPFAPRIAAGLAEFLERARGRILRDLLPGIAVASDRGKHVAVVLADFETYYAYVEHFEQPGTDVAPSAGLFVFAPPGREWGYFHFACMGTDVSSVERFVAHELTHDLVSHLPIPSWLNEGIATTVEGVLLRDPAFVVQVEDLDDHRAFWRDGAIQGFWSGEAVRCNDDGSRLSYHLARMAVTALSRDYERFRTFVLAASAEDGGEAACVSVYGGSLGGLIERFLGPGDWTPHPESSAGPGGEED